MRIESKLCHLSENKAVVQAIGWLNDKNVGSALAEASTVELAEDKAISRLYKRLNIHMNNESEKNHKKEEILNNKLKDEIPKLEKIETTNIDIEPTDWSKELTAIDLEIKRLKGTREDEINYLKKHLGYNNRNKITKYGELVNYLEILKNIDGVNSNSITKESLIEESNIILDSLSWDNKQGRDYLKREYNVSTRKELDEKQLLSFISNLKSIQSQKLSQ